MKLKHVKLDQKLSIKNIIIQDPVNKDLIPLYYYSVDSILVCLKKWNIEKCYTLKDFWSMCIKKANFDRRRGRGGKLTKDYKAGVTFIRENFPWFELIIIEIKNKKIYEECNIVCNGLAEDFNRKNLAAKMLIIIREVNKT